MTHLPITMAANGPLMIGTTTCVQVPIVPLPSKVHGGTVIAIKQT